MDRSFLSDARVIEASRHFVCIRLATYEDRGEADFLKAIFLPASGDLENTTFAVLSPDGRRRLARAGRGPQHAWRRPSEMADGLDQIAAGFDRSETAFGSERNLPIMEDVRVAMNVAACDHLPLIVIRGSNAEEIAALSMRLRPVVWSRTLAGQFIFAESRKAEDLARIRGLKSDERIVVIRPDAFGASGDRLLGFKPDAAPAQIESDLKKVVAEYEPEILEYRMHLELGIELGVDWKTEIPETDQQSVRARRRARGTR